MKRIITFACASLLSVSGMLCMAADTPVFPGGESAINEYIAQNLRYPALAKENGIEGVVEVAFTVKADGSVGSIKITRMIDPDLEQEAIRLVKNMPRWTPADKNGAPVDAPVSLRIPFILSE